MTDEERLAITGKIPKSLREAFYHRVLEKFGSLKGNLSKCFEEAIKLWLKTNKKSSFKTLPEFVNVNEIKQENPESNA